jgi:hypothetical protein
MLNIYFTHIYFIYQYCLFEPVEEVRPTVELKQQHWELGGPLHHVWLVSCPTVLAFTCVHLVPCIQYPRVKLWKKILLKSNALHNRH